LEPFGGAKPCPGSGRIACAMPLRGKSSAAFTAALGIVTLAGSGLAFRERIREEWYIWKLNSADGVESELASRKLVGMSPRVVGPLIDVIRRDKAEEVTFFVLEGTSREAIGLTLKSYTLYKMGDKALPLIDKLLERDGMDDDPGGRLWFILREVRNAIAAKWPGVPVFHEVPPELLTSP
jgi:hypothetical protein